MTAIHNYVGYKKSKCHSKATADFCI